MLMRANRLAGLSGSNLVANDGLRLALELTSPPEHKKVETARQRDQAGAYVR